MLPSACANPAQSMLLNQDSMKNKPVALASILQACKESGPNGITTQAMRLAIPHFKWDTVRKYMDLMIDSGRMWKCGPDKHVRWFTDKAWFDAFLPTVDAFVAAEKAHNKAIALANKRAYQKRRKALKAAERIAIQKAKKDKAGPVTIKRPEKESRRLTGTTIVTPSGVKVTKVPGFVGHLRWLPDAPISGGFAALGVGRYLE